MKRATRRQSSGKAKDSDELDEDGDEEEEEEEEEDAPPFPDHDADLEDFVEPDPMIEYSQITDRDRAVDDLHRHVQTGECLEFVVFDEGGYAGRRGCSSHRRGNRGASD